MTLLPLSLGPLTQFFQQSLKFTFSLFVGFLNNVTPREQGGFDKIYSNSCPTSHRTVRFHQKDRPANVVVQNSHCLFWESYKTKTQSWAKCRDFSFRAGGTIVAFVIIQALSYAPERVGSQGTVVSRASLDTGWTVKFSHPGWGEIFRILQDRLRRPPRPLYKGYRDSFPGLKRSGRGVHYPHFSRSEIVGEQNLVLSR